MSLSSCIFLNGRILNGIAGNIFLLPERAGIIRIPVRYACLMSIMGNTRSRENERID